ncbi:HypC/HybG/HupF family hydrogenase formation chaperone [Leptolyngbya sp. AN02str]|uniref:HypC/HybG/HupF family hydrogenase formation chaperone n=1 Tax=Leptolyngbya sp. AN02str TaxID=3423363 RepID=UPI003D31AF68
MCLAVPGKVIEIYPSPDPLMQMGKVSFGGVMKQISLAYVPDAKIGDYVMVHVGFALSILNPQEAEQTLNDLQNLQAEPRDDGF